MNDELDEIVKGIEDVLKPYLFDPVTDNLMKEIRPLLSEVYEKYFNKVVITYDLQDASFDILCDDSKYGNEPLDCTLRIA